MNFSVLCCVLVCVLFDWLVIFLLFNSMWFVLGVFSSLVICSSVDFFVFEGVISVIILFCLMCRDRFDSIGIGVGSFLL